MFLRRSWALVHNPISWERERERGRERESECERKSPAYPGLTSQTTEIRRGRSIFTWEKLFDLNFSLGSVLSSFGRTELGPHHQLSPVIKLGIRHQRQKESMRKSSPLISGDCIDLWPRDNSWSSADSFLFDLPDQTSTKTKLGRVRVILVNDRACLHNWSHGQFV